MPEFIERLRHLHSNVVDNEQNKTELKFLVTSRPYFDIEQKFNPLISANPTVRLAGEEETVCNERCISSQRRQ